IINELSKFSPSEVLLNDNILQYKGIIDFIKNKLNCVCEIYGKDEVDENACLTTVLNHFKGKTIEQLNLTDKNLAVTALGSLISYINKTQKNGAMRIVNVNFYKDDEYMCVDITAKRNLEIIKTMRSGEKRGTLLWVLDKTKTSMGKRYIKKALEQPLINLTQITKRQCAIKELIATPQKLDEIISLFNNIYDIERLMTRVVYGTVNPREIRSLGCTISNLPNLKKITETFSSSYLMAINDNIDTLEEISSLIDNAISDEPPIAMKDGGVIKQGFNEELDNYRDLCFNAKEYIAKIEQREKEKTGISKLKIGYNRIFGYYIEVTNSFLSQVPETYIRKQTLSNCERYITQELKDLEAKVLSANDKILALELEIFDEVRKFVAQKIDIIQSTATAISKLDFICSLSIVALENNYV
ncbi:MAG: DNA mismatch repair protein MutS, partial [Oscillospiraceae bacterium]